MAGIEMARHGNFRIRDCVAAIRERDPKMCWAFESLIDHDDFKRLQERTHERNAKNINSNLTFDVEEYSDDVTIGEFLRKQRTLKVKKKQMAVEVDEQRLVVAGLKLLGSVSRVHEPVVGVGGAKRKHKTLEVEGARLSVAKPLAGGSRGGLGGLKPPGLASRVNEPVVGVGGAKKKQKALEGEELRDFVAKPLPGGSCSGLGLLKPPDSVSVVHEPVEGVGGAKKKQTAREIEEARPIVAKQLLAGSSLRLGGLKASSSVSRLNEPSRLNELSKAVHEPLVGVVGAKNKQKAVDFEKSRRLAAKPLPAGSYVSLGGLKPLGSASRVHEPVVGVGEAKNKQKVSGIEEPILFTANGPGGIYPWNRNVLPCSINRNPAEFSTQTAKKFMRRIMG